MGPPWEENVLGLADPSDEAVPEVANSWQLSTDKLPEAGQHALP